MKPALLLVDDEEAIRISFGRYLERGGFSVRSAADLAEAREALSATRFDAILLDVNLPDGNGLDWIVELRESFPQVAIIVITGRGDIPQAVEAMRRGADHFLAKPVSMPDLEVFLRKGLELGHLRRSRRAHQRLSPRSGIFFGESPSMAEVKHLAGLAAESDAPIVLEGETGVGKGVIARYIHEHSARRTEPLVEINCSILRGDLLASELFGHTRGAFTSANEGREGLLDVADGGTLFLDEIGDMDLAVQSQFLKVLEEKSYRRLGETRERRSDFRPLFATNRTLFEDVRQGRFRKDLYFRVQVFPIQIPPLRDRPDDIAPLVHFFLDSLGAAQPSITPEALGLLRHYPWPGNVRELKNVIERSILLSRKGPLGIEHFPGLKDSARLNGLAGRHPGPSATLNPTEILEAVHHAGGDTKKAAEALGISRATLYRRIKGINP